MFGSQLVSIEWLLGLLGIRVIPWTVNDSSAMDELMAMGVDGIITDRPDVLLNVMRRCHVV